MFERYTEKARRVIFFARYEASQYGSPYIETEHLLLGLLRENKAVAKQFLHSEAGVESIRKQIEAQMTVREKMSTSVDLPLSPGCKKVLAFAAEEAERLSHEHIGTAHLLLGLLREQSCNAAILLVAEGVSLEAVRAQLRSGPETGSGKETNTISFDLPGEPTAVHVDQATLDFIKMFGAEARRILMYAVAEAERLGHAQIGAGHLLLGILREESSAAAKLLQANGLGQKRVEAELFREISDSPGAPGES